MGSSLVRITFAVVRLEKFELIGHVTPHSRSWAIVQEGRLYALGGPRGTPTRAEDVA